MTHMLRFCMVLKALTLAVDRLQLVPDVAPAEKLSKPIENQLVILANQLIEK